MLTALPGYRPLLPAAGHSDYPFQLLKSGPPAPAGVGRSCPCAPLSPSAWERPPWAHVESQRGMLGGTWPQLSERLPLPPTLGEGCQEMHLSLGWARGTLHLWSGRPWELTRTQRASLRLDLCLPLLVPLPAGMGESPALLYTQRGHWESPVRTKNSISLGIPCPMATHLCPLAHSPAGSPLGLCAGTASPYYCWPEGACPLDAPQQPTPLVHPCVGGRARRDWVPLCRLFPLWLNV